MNKYCLPAKLTNYQSQGATQPHSRGGTPPTLLPGQTQSSTASHPWPKRPRPVRKKKSFMSGDKGQWRMSTAFACPAFTPPAFLWGTTSPWPSIQEIEVGLTLFLASGWAHDPELTNKSTTSPRHRNWFKDGHMTRPGPMRANPRIFAGALQETEWSFYWGW